MLCTESNKRSHFEEPPAPIFVCCQARQKKSGKREERKQAKDLPLVGMLNKDTRVYKKPISIKELLKGTKFDVSLLEFVAWSPALCKEIK